MQPCPEEFPANEDCEYLWRDNSTEHVHFSTFEKISSETGKDLHCGSAPVVDFQTELLYEMELGKGLIKFAIFTLNRHQ